MLETSSRKVSAITNGSENRSLPRTEQHQVGHEVDPHAEHLHAALLMAVVVCVVVLVRRRIAGQLRAGQQVHARTSFSLARLAWLASNSSANDSVIRFTLLDTWVGGVPFRGMATARLLVDPGNAGRV
ncbi:hypothetical protein G6F66_014162 [Rhizopus arrhizus]|nr:hypothetical protein G6F66_014162 [Rhizopus arrhizus]